VNDTSEVNIDAALVDQGGANPSRTDEKLVEMSNPTSGRNWPIRSPPGPGRGHMSPAPDRRFGAEGSRTRRWPYFRPEAGPIEPPARAARGR
jgi:hypothetical protein